MLPVYNIGSEAIETVYTYEEWLKEYNRREAKRRIKQRAHLYYMKQHILGAIMAAIGIIMPFIFNGDATISLVILPLGVFLMLTQEKVITF